MLATGSEKLERVRDGRVVYIGAERVDDVTSHPAFRNALQALQAGLGPDRLGIRRPPHAL
jgi:4-hydroxyphenylacetate 3-monooxygenase